MVDFDSIASNWQLSKSSSYVSVFKYDGDDSSKNKSSSSSSSSGSSGPDVQIPHHVNARRRASVDIAKFMQV